MLVKGATGHQTYVYQLILRGHTTYTPYFTESKDISLLVNIQMAFHLQVQNKLIFVTITSLHKHTIL